MTRVRELRNWRAGEPLQAQHLQEPVDAIRDLQRVFAPTAASPANQADVDENNEGALSGVQQLTIVSRETRTERIEDADDPDTYVDVQITTSITWKFPDGTLLKAPFE